MQAVLPLLSRDVERFALLARSLELFFPELGRVFVVVPDKLQGKMADSVRRAAGNLDHEIVPEQALVPEMATFRHLPGWYKHQLVKLAATDVVSSDYYLTLDADVICTRKTTTAALLPGGRSACFVMHKEEHRDWYDGAEAVLGLHAPRKAVLHNVTPVVWSTAAVLGLVTHVENVARRRSYARGLRGLRQRFLFNVHLALARHARPSWRAWLAASYPWSEYAMYFTWLEATGRFERYHFESDYCIYDVERSVWYEEGFDAWEAAPLFQGIGPPYFAVVQSNMRIPAARVWQKVSPWLGWPDRVAGAA